MFFLLPVSSLLLNHDSSGLVKEAARFKAQSNIRKSQPDYLIHELTTTFRVQIPKASFVNKEFRAPLRIQLNEWPTCQMDMLCQINLAFCLPNPNCEVPNTPSLPRVASSFPADVPQWHWCCTSSCLTSAFSSLSRGLHILSEVFLASRTQAYLLTNNVFVTCLVSGFIQSEEPSVLLTPAASIVMGLVMKNMFRVQEETKEQAEGLAATLLTGVVPPAELLLPLSGRGPVTSMWSEVPPCGCFLISCTAAILGLLLTLETGPRLTPSGGWKYHVIQLHW